MNTCPPAKSIRWMKAKLSANSASVSPGKPVITSVVIATPGINFRAASTSKANSSGVVFRAIRRNVAALPDCRGRCKCRAKRVSCHNEKKFSSRSQGSREDNRIRMMGASVKMVSTRWRKCKGESKSCPQEPR